jgi:carbon dioxide concentrating mechanism protein CcmN
MLSPSLQLHPITLSHFCVNGDVTIREGAAIAPGVLLQADLNCRIIVGAGVCLGIGTVIHATSGTIEVRQGANLGAGVLVVGSGVIGDRACIGAMTTLFNQSVEPNAMIAPGTMLVSESPTLEEPIAEPASDASPQAEPEAVTEEISDPNLPQSGPAADESDESDEIDSPIVSDSSARAASVYGQAYVNQMLGRLFPHQQDLNGSGNSS